MAVLFVSGLGRSFDRAENLNALYSAYPGEKKALCRSDEAYEREVRSGKYSLMVTDLFPTERRMTTVMVWHAIQGGKHIGLDEKKTYYRKEYAQCMDAVISAGTGAVGMWKSCTGVKENRIHCLGMPRTDRYIGKKKDRARAHGMRIYLYAPTFRFPWEPEMQEIDWAWMDAHLEDDELMIVKAHPHGHTMMGQKRRHIIEADRMNQSVNYLYDADVIITDYSSIIFDGYLLGKPAVLYEKEPGYVESRGMYLPYPDGYSDCVARSEAELLERMRERARHPEMTTAERKCVETVADRCDGKSCERICALIDGMR